MPKNPTKPARPAKAKAKPPAKPPAKMGRPSLYTPELAASILTRVANGEFLSHICREPGMPCIQAVWEWRNAHPDFGKAYAHAREMQAQTVAEAGHAEAMKAGTDLDPTAARVRWDAARWMAARLAPKTWSDKPQGEAGTAENPLVLLLTEMRARALPITKTIDSVSEEIEE